MTTVSDAADGRRPHVRDARGRHALRHRADRVGQGLAVGGNLRSQPRLARLRLPLSASRAATRAARGRSAPQQPGKVTRRDGTRGDVPASNLHATHEDHLRRADRRGPRALDAAIALGIPHGGWCPRGRLAEDGRIPWRYNLTETDSPHYAVRTERNVLDSDATLILCRGTPSGGTELTLRLADRARPAGDGRRPRRSRSPRPKSTPGWPSTRSRHSTLPARAKARAPASAVKRRSFSECALRRRSRHLRSAAIHPARRLRLVGPALYPEPAAKKRRYRVPRPGRPRHTRVWCADASVRLDQPAVRAVRRHVVRLIEEPEAFPLVQNLRAGSRT